MADTRLISNIRRLALLTALLLMPGAAVNAADTESVSLPPDIVIGAGHPGRGYWGVAARLQQVAAEHELRVELRETGGSIENLRLLAEPEGPVSLVLTQSDALVDYLQQNPGFSSEFDVLESIGDECVFIITGTGSGIRTSEDLKADKGYRLAISGPDSGVAVTFRGMSRMDPAFGNTEVVFMDTVEALEQIRAGDEDAVDALMLVQRPKIRSTEIRQALSQQDRFRLVTVTGDSLTGKLPDGKRVFEQKTIPMLREKYESGLNLETVCTEGLLLASKDKLSGKARTGLNRIIDFQWMSIYPTRE